MRMDFCPVKHPVQRLGEDLIDRNPLQMIVLLRIGHGTRAKKRPAEIGFPAALTIQLRPRDCTLECTAAVSADFHHVEYFQKMPCVAFLHCQHTGFASTQPAVLHNMKLGRK